MRVSKKILAVALAITLMAIVIPFASFASNELTVTGTIQEIGSNYLLVTVHSTDHVFYLTSGTEISTSTDYFFIGEGVRISFAPENPSTATSVYQTYDAANAAPPPRKQHTHYAVTGVITDAGMSSITILKNDGNYRTFGKEDAAVVGAPDGIALGDTVEIVYDANYTKDAMQINMIAHGGNHRDRPAEQITHYSVTGDITDAGMSTITILTRSGKYSTFDKEDAQIVGVRHGILLGDTVRIVYAKDDPQIAIQVIMVAEGDNH